MSTGRFDPQTCLGSFYTDSFHGAAQTVTGSQHLITVNGRTLLLACGLYQGKLGETRSRNRECPFHAQPLVLWHFPGRASNTRARSRTRCNEVARAGLCAPRKG